MGSVETRSPQEVSYIMENEVKQPARKKSSKVVDIILTTVGVLLLLITAVGVITKFVSKDNLIFGFRSDVVLTESMATLNPEVEEEYKANGWTNQIKVHDWIFTTKVDESDLKVGDIVTYNHPLIGVTTHRIVAIKEHNGETYFTIRADAVGVRDTDGDFKYEAIVGKVTHNAGQFGQVIFFLQSIYGVILMVGLAMICFVYTYLSDYTKKEKKEEPVIDSSNDNNEKQD